MVLGAAPALFEAGKLLGKGGSAVDFKNSEFAPAESGDSTWPCAAVWPPDVGGITGGRWSNVNAGRTGAGMAQSENRQIRPGFTSRKSRIDKCKPVGITVLRVFPGKCVWKSRGGMPGERRGAVRRSAEFLLDFFPLK